MSKFPKNIASLLSKLIHDHQIPPYCPFLSFSLFNVWPAVVNRPLGIQVTTWKIQQLNVWRRFPNVNTNCTSTISLTLSFWSLALVATEIWLEKIFNQSSTSLLYLHIIIIIDNNKHDRLFCASLPSYFHSIIFLLLYYFGSFNSRKLWKLSCLFRMWSKPIFIHLTPILFNNHIHFTMNLLLNSQFDRAKCPLTSKQTVF